MAFFLPPEVDLFPHPLAADEDGFLALGGDLSPDNLLLAYQFGIFPWTNENEPLLWWYTHPRCVLFPDSLRITKSMRPYLNNNKWRWTIDTDFPAVIEGCRESSRKGQKGTWIFQELEDSFIELHERGYAHSVEVWEGDELIGGLYGMALGKIFYGESMFAKVSNASKFGFINFVRWLHTQGFWLIDCQQRTQHLLSLGAETIGGEKFMDYLRRNIFEKGYIGQWEKDK